MPSLCACQLVSFAANGVRPLRPNGHSSAPNGAGFASHYAFILISLFIGAFLFLCILFLKNTPFPPWSVSEEKKSSRGQIIEFRGFILTPITSEIIPVVKVARKSFMREETTRNVDRHHQFSADHECEVNNIQKSF
uniref:Transmembrane protein n=1 Tax=Ascaris lumbricoides TaxID=6252 RepID=A0A0M3IAW3_ASCLU